MSLPSSSHLSASPPRLGLAGAGAASLPAASPLGHAASASLSAGGGDFGPARRRSSSSERAVHASSVPASAFASASASASASAAQGVEGGGSSSSSPSRPPHEAGGRGTHCAFVLVAEFDIDKGSTLSHQYPAGIGQDEYMLAELMLPDGAHARAEDWTTFFLKHPPSASSSSGSGAGAGVGEEQAQGVAEGAAGGPSITHVLNLVRTKHDNSVRRGALVKAMAIGTTHPFIHVFKPLLLLALDDFFSTGGVAPLQRLYDALNSMDLSGMPQLSRDEKLILRASEARDLFRDRFGAPAGGAGLERSRSRNGEDATAGAGGKTLRPRPSSNSIALSLGDDLGGSALEERASSPSPAPVMPQPLRRPSGASIRAHSPALSERRPPLLATALGVDGPRQRRPSAGAASLLSSAGHAQIQGVVDTHWFETSVTYGAKHVRLRIPVATFAEEVGEYSLLALHSSFGSSTPLGPQHPHLHSNGHLTPSLILLFNALATSKRVIFLGHGQPAHVVASHVLAACALGSGGGAVFAGLIRRAFPYCNLGMMDELERTPGYIAGVTNPRFEDLHAWDVLFNIDTGKISVAKDIDPAPPLRPPQTRANAASASRHGTFSSGSIASMSGSAGIGHEVPPGEMGEFGALHSAGASNSASAAASIKSGKERAGAAPAIEARQDALDVLFVEDLLAAVQARYGGERYLLARWVDYAQGFARAAARHEEHFYGATALAPPSQPFLNGQLGSGSGGVVHGDRELEAREIQNNAHRVEGWIATESYRLYRDEEAARERHRAATGQTYDLTHQILRLKRARHIGSSEAELIFTTLASSIRSVEQMTELLSLHPAHSGGLASLSVGLLHPSTTVRNATLELLLQLSSFPLGQKFIQQLNVFHRLTFARLLSERGEAAALVAPASASAGAATANQPQFARRPSGGATRDGLPSSAGSLPFSAGSFAGPTGSHTAYLSQPTSANDARALPQSATSFAAAT